MRKLQARGQRWWAQLLNSVGSMTRHLKHKTHQLIQYAFNIGSDFSIASFM